MLKIMLVLAVMPLFVFADDNSGTDTKDTYYMFGPAKRPRRPAQDQDVIYRKALAKARAENKPLMVFFGADWCPRCQLLMNFFSRQKALTFEVVFIELLSGFEIQPTGQAVLAELGYKKNREHLYPFAFVVNAQTGKATRVAVPQSPVRDRGFLPQLLDNIHRALLAPETTEDSED